MKDSQVGSVELEITRRLLRRRILVIKTLEVCVSIFPVGGIAGSRTYNPPRAKTPINANFCLFGSWRDLSTGMGYTKIKMSDKM